MFSAVLA